MPNGGSSRYSRRIFAAEWRGSVWEGVAGGLGTIAIALPIFYCAGIAGVVVFIGVLAAVAFTLAWRNW